MDIFKHTAKTNKKIKRADQILPEVYGTTLSVWHSSLLTMSASYECCTSEKRPVLYKDIYVLLVLLGRDL